MKIFLASLLEPHNFGPGRKIAIFHKNSEKNLGIDFYFDALTPSSISIEQYNKKRPIEPQQAIVEFVNLYQAKLRDFANEIGLEAIRVKKNILDVLPFQDGDTLISWERESNNNYRVHLKNILIDLGYEVILH